MAEVFQITADFVGKALDCIIGEENVRHEVLQLTNSKLEKSKELTNEELCNSRRPRG
jgi:hypothetical protein